MFDNNFNSKFPAICDLHFVEIFQNKNKDQTQNSKNSKIIEQLDIHSFRL